MSIDNVMVPVVQPRVPPIEPLPWIDGTTPCPRRRDSRADEPPACAAAQPTYLFPCKHRLPARWIDDAGACRRVRQEACRCGDGKRHWAWHFPFPHDIPAANGGTQAQCYEANNQQPDQDGQTGQDYQRCVGVREHVGVSSDLRKPAGLSSTTISSVPQSIVKVCGRELPAG